MLPLYRSTTVKGNSLSQRFWKRKRTVLLYAFILTVILLYVYLFPNTVTTTTTTPQDIPVVNLDQNIDDEPSVPQVQDILQPQSTDDVINSHPVQHDGTEPMDQQQQGTDTKPKITKIPVNKKAKTGDTDSKENKERLEAVKNAFVHAYTSYERYAFGHDELKPLSRSYHDWIPGGVGMTIIDSLSTMMLMGMDDHIKRARDWVEEHLNFDRDADISVFETNIRMLGGLISAYDLSTARGKTDKVFLDKAIQIADRLMFAFNSSSGIPYATVNLHNGRAYGPSWTGGASILAEVGTLQIEFQRLSQLTGNQRYQAKALRVFDIIGDRSSTDGLYPTFISPDSGHFTSGHITFGALGDSFYEYLVKVWMQGGKKQHKLRTMFDSAMQGMISRLILKSQPSGLTYVAESQHGGIDHKMDHLACFVGGMLVLGAKDASESVRAKYLEVAAGITETCYQMYAKNPNGISPETVRFGGNDFHTATAYYILRPEAVESIFYMWRQTKDKKYRDWAWSIFQAIEKNCRTDAGFVGLRSVDMVPPPQDDHMQSFFLAETLKYLYLTFAPDSALDLNKWVFNTEAHPVKVL